MASKFKSIAGCNPLVPLNGLLVNLPSDELEEWEGRRINFAQEEDIDPFELSPTMVEFADDGHVFLYCSTPNGNLALTCVHRLMIMRGLIHTLPGHIPNPTMN